MFFFVFLISLLCEYLRLIAQLRSDENDFHHECKEVSYSNWSPLFVGIVLVQFLRSWL